MVINKTDCTPSDAQNAANLYLLQNENEIAVTVLQALSAACRRILDEIRNDIDDEVLAEEFDAAVARNELDTGNGVKKQVELTEIGFLEQEKNEQAYISFDFRCGW